MSAHLLIVPGLGDSGPDHWQTHLERDDPEAVRANQPDWTTPELGRWSASLARHLPDRDEGAILVAHSFGCFAAACAARTNRRQVRALMLVAPPDPRRFGLSARLPRSPLEAPTILIASTNDPWCDAEVARHLAHRWGAQFLSLGNAGHINVDSGFGPWPFGRRLVDTLRRLHGGRRDAGLARCRPNPDRHLTGIHP